MLVYICRRILYAIPILIGVNVLTFMLFFVVNSTDDIAYVHLGSKHTTREDITNWKKNHGYDLPLFYNDKTKGIAAVTTTIFWQKSINLFKFNFGIADDGRDINSTLKERFYPSLVLAIPAFFLGLAVNIGVAMLLAFLRGSYLDTLGVTICVMLMSISTLFYIVGGQFVAAKLLKLVPISGFADGWMVLKFSILPVIISVIGGIGAGGRWYRSFFLEELNKDYVRTAKAKGLGEFTILFKHVFRNALIPILTGVVVVLPLLFMGSLLTESFFGIPGLGSYTVEAIRNQDFAVVRSMVFLGSALYILGLILTDISYVVVDPRVRV